VDEEQFRELYVAHYPRVLAYARRRASPETAREASDETFLVAWRRRAELPEHVLPWLLVTARNTLADLGRRGRRTDALTEVLSRTAAAAQEPGVEDTVLERLTVLQALAELSEGDRELILLTAWDGLGALDAARVLGCSSGAVNVRLHRARRRLTTALRHLDGNPPVTRPEEHDTPTATADTSTNTTAGGHRPTSTREQR
jgi:RNA polymerase sigma-70 factor (ECF subfamily)